ncbi:disease resistance family protein [Salix suchowensis]|nr:disease resistance family protein [Salix suchowensis]
MSGSLTVSSSPAALRLRWDVFLSFRGEDTRESFTKDLYNSLKEQEIRVFLDNAGMTQGDEIPPTLMEAIQDSALSIIILSPRYANSHWCLEEMEKLCELRRLILPVFYQVDPSNVRRQKGPFEQDFENHSKRFGDKVVKWREAMTKIGGISGFVFDASGHDHLIRQMVNRVLAELRTTPVGIATYTVGLDSRVENLKKRFIDDKSNRIYVLGLYGMGGIGKTTLATALFNKLVGHFESRSFISNIKEISKEDGGLVKLQNKLLGDLFPNRSDVIVKDIADGIAVIKGLLHEKRVLVVLDDVNQLNLLAGKRDWFGEGSRVIVTTRNRGVLVDHLVNQFYEVKELGSLEAVKLFSYHALRREEPTAEYLDITKKIISITGQLPLALEVFGSALFNERGIKKWEDALKKLQQIRPGELQDVLRISYDGLDDEEQYVFLDIACLFIKMRMKREEAIDVLKGCGFRAETAITVLTVKCLVKIGADNELWMHDQLRDMGRQIVINENLGDPGMRSRLWDRGDIMTVLKHKKGTRHVQGLILDFEKKNDVRAQKSSWVRALLSSALDSLIKMWKMFFLQRAEEGEVILDTQAMKPMVNLRLLQINHANVKGKFKNFPSSLKWLQWKNCPLENLPSDYAPHELAVLDLSESGIQRVWGWTSNKVSENLMVMNLRHCYNLVASPDLSSCKSLEKLDFEGCIRLTKIHESLGNVRTLLQLNLNNCNNLVEFPSDVSGLKLHKRAARTLGKPDFSKVLSLNHSAVEELPGSVGSLSNLEELSLMGCRSVTTIPESIRNLQSLMKFSINGSPIKELPTAIGSLPYLKTLFAGGCHFLSKLPDSIGGLASISELQLDGTSISDLPEQIDGLKMIQKLHLRNCTSLRALPEAIGMILNLTTVDLFGCNITELPESFGSLENLEILILNECKKLHKLPDSTENLKSLCHLLMKKTAVTVLPGNFGNLSSLMILEMQKDPLESPRTQDQSVVLTNSFTKLSLLEELNARAWRISGKIPDDFEKLSSLKVLKLGNNNFSSLPSSLCGLSLLQNLHLPHCEELVSLPPLPPSLEELDASNCFGLETIADVSGLERLTLLDITNCEKVEDIPGIECLKFFKTIIHELNIRNLSMPGSKLPDWFSQESVVHFSERKNRTIKAVIVCVVVSLDREIAEDLRYSPYVPDIKAIILDQNNPIYSTSLYLLGIPKIHEDQIHICRYSNITSLVSSLKDGCKIQVLLASHDDLATRQIIYI